MEKIYNEQITEYNLFGKFLLFSTKRITKEAMQDDVTNIQIQVSPKHYKEEFDI